MCGSQHITIFAFIVANIMAVEEKTGMVHQRYALKGGTVSLSLGEHQHHLDNMKWKRNGFIITNGQSINPDVHLGSLNVNDSDGSLIITNVTEKDNGLYKATMGVWEKKVIEYQLNVEEAVSEVVIDTHIIFQSNSSTDPCRITVKCSADGDSESFDCDLRTCTSINFTLSKINFTVAVTSNGIVECNARNHVSTTTSSKSVGNACLEKSMAVEEIPNKLSVPAVAIGCGLGLGVLVVCSIIKGYCYFRKKIQDDDPEKRDTTTIYSVVCKPQSPTENSAGPTSPTTVYDDPSKCDNVREKTTVYNVVCNPQSPTENSARDTSPTTVYDVPSKCVKAPKGPRVQTPKVTQEPPLEDRTVTATSKTQGETEEDSQLTVYWKLGQK